MSAPGYHRSCRNRINADSSGGVALTLTGDYAIVVLDVMMPRAEQEFAALFTPFFRAAGAARAQGYGLGLAIARRCIEAHGGTIKAANRDGGGLAVTLMLPAGRPS